jgi:signal transduction histidine kinase
MAAHELETRDRFLRQVSLGLSQKLDRMRGCKCRELDEIRAFARELAIIAGDEDALMPRRRSLDVGKLVRTTIRGNACVQLRSTGNTRGRFDPAELESIVAELLSNALKYGKGQRVDVHVEGLAACVRITIVDRGPGLERDSRRGRLFARGPRSRTVPGFGVGVWLVQRQVRAHGGRFRLFTPRTGGTVARVELPRRSDGVAARGRSRARA